MLFPTIQENADLDGDGLGDNSDDDIDGDGVVNVDDVWPMDGIIWSDSDGDGLLTKGCMNYQIIVRLPTERVELG